MMNAEAQTSDHEKIWTTVGSAGTIDETDSGKVFFDHGVVQMGIPISDPFPLAQEGTASELLATEEPTDFHSLTESAVIRYNVTPVDGLLFVQPRPCHPGSVCDSIGLMLRYLADGNGQVVAKLIELDMATGFEIIRLTFNSDSFASANHYQVNLVGETGPSWHFDFIGKAYYIEATLTRNTILGGSTAGIQIIKIIISEVIT